MESLKDLSGKRVSYMGYFKDTIQDNLIPQECKDYLKNEVEAIIEACEEYFNMIKFFKNKYSFRISKVLMYRKSLVFHMTLVTNNRYVITREIRLNIKCNDDDNGDENENGDYEYINPFEIKVDDYVKRSVNDFNDEFNSIIKCIKCINDHIKNYGELIEFTYEHRKQNRRDKLAFIVNYKGKCMINKEYEMFL